MDRLSINSSQRFETSFIISFFIACLLHIAFFGWGMWFNSHIQAPLKPKAKVVVQTIALNPQTVSKPILATLDKEQISQSIPQAPASEKSIVAEKKEEKKPAPIPQKKEPPKEVSNIPKNEPKKKSEPIKKPPVKKKEEPKKAPPKNKTLPPPPKVNKEPKKQEPPKKVIPKKTDELKIAEEKRTALEKKKQEEKVALEKKRTEEKIAAEKRKAAELQAAIDKENAILVKAKESLSKMGETRGKLETVSKSSVDLTRSQTPQILGSLQIEALAFADKGTSSTFGVKEMRYSDGVAYRLKSSLRLPEYGAVKIKLTLSRAGKVEKVETVHSESRKNKSYVEEKVKNILFSSFGNEFPGASEMTFAITLQND